MDEAGQLWVAEPVHLGSSEHQCADSLNTRPRHMERVLLDLFRGLSQKTVRSTKGEIRQSYIAVKNVLLKMISRDKTFVTKCNQDLY